MGEVVGPPPLQRLGDGVESGCRGVVPAVRGVLVGGGGAVDDVEARLGPAAGECHVALLEGGLVAGVVQRPVEGGALHAVGGAGVPVVEVTVGQVPGGHGDASLLVELDYDGAPRRVECGDDAGAAVLHEVTGR